MNKNNIIQYFISHQKEILFSNFCKFFIEKEEQKKIIDLYFPENSFSNESFKIIMNTEWFLIMEEPDLLYPIGIYHLNKEQHIVISFDSMGYFKYLSDSIQDLPYALLSLRHEYIIDIEKVYIDFQAYEKWCYDNNIIIDKLSLFHNTDGSIVNNFDNYFTYQDEHYYEFFPTEEMQKF